MDTTPETMETLLSKVARFIGSLEDGVEEGSGPPADPDRSTVDTKNIPGRRLKINMSSEIIKTTAVNTFLLDSTYMAFPFFRFLFDFLHADS